MALCSAALLFSLSMSTVLSRIVTEQGIGCRSTEYVCSDGSCIPLSSLCDGISDCLTNEDEETCSFGQSSSLRVKKQVELVTCTFDQWQCKNGSCVSIEDRCDGAVDCADGSDETIDSCWDNICTPNQFRCQYGGCVEQSAYCDGVVDCADSSDEIMARCYNYTIDEQDDIFDMNTILSRSKRQASNCKKNQFSCRDGTCISSYDKCDGIIQCPDGSDETFALCRKTKLKIYKKATDNAYKTEQLHLWKGRPKALIRAHTPIRCQSNWFRCMYGACVDGTAPCNNIQDCADNSDELLPKCRNENEEVRGNFRCDDGSTIPAYSHCDGVRDCPDGSDETLRTCAGKTCATYLFQCAYGACVDQGSDCNGKRDCEDNSDEWDDVCNRTSNFTTTQRPPPSTACVLPKYPTYGTYTVTNLPNARPGQVINNPVVLTFTCRGAHLRPRYSKNICFNGEWQEPLDSIENVCVPHCKVPKDETVTYTCVLQGTAEGVDVCNEYVEEGTRIRPNCNSNYYLRETADNVCLGTGSWYYSNPCEPECGTFTPIGFELSYGGEEVEVGEVTWHAGIYKKSTKSQICGGTLISKKVVLSAAHCFWVKLTRKLDSASSYNVGLGKVNRLWDAEEEKSIAQKSDISEIKVPPYYQDVEGRYQSDIAILLLTETIVYTRTVRPICLDFRASFSEIQLQPGNKGLVAGWGYTGEAAVAAPKLRVVELPYITFEECKANITQGFREYLTGDKICAGYNDGKAGLCKGDSGGGLVFSDTGRLNVIRYYLQGIVSTAPTADTACNTRTYVTFTDITKHSSFIKRYLTYV